jgi:hypothetical protein
MAFNNPISVKLDTRAAARTPSSVRGVVLVKESSTESWKEHTDVTSLSKSGAGFTLSRPCTVGRLVSLVLEMPDDLRAYDQGKELYPAIGIVQYCYAAQFEDRTVYNIGVGFIGKRSPDGFKQNPAENYRINGMNKEGLWTVVPTKSEFQNRKEPRYFLGVPVTLTYKRRSDRETFRHSTITVNIAAGGASVATDIEANVGDKIKFACKDVNFYAIAEVRGRRRKEGEPSCLNLEFIEARFPVEKLVNAATQPNAAR